MPIITTVKICHVGIWKNENIYWKYRRLKCCEELSLCYYNYAKITNISSILEWRNSFKNWSVFKLYVIKFLFICNSSNDSRNLLLICTHIFTMGYMSVHNRIHKLFTKRRLLSNRVCKVRKTMKITAPFRLRHCFGCFYS